MGLGERCGERQKQEKWEGGCLWTMVWMFGVGEKNVKQLTGNLKKMLRASIVLVEGKGLIPSNHVCCLTAKSNSSSRKFDTSGVPWAPELTYTCVYTYK